MCHNIYSVKSPSATKFYFQSRLCAVDSSSPPLSFPAHAPTPGKLLQTHPPPPKLSATLSAPLHPIPALLAGEVSLAALEHRHLGAEGAHAGGAHSGSARGCLMLHITRFCLSYQGENFWLVSGDIF